MSNLCPNTNKPLKNEKFTPSGPLKVRNLHLNTNKPLKNEKFTPMGPLEVRNLHPLWAQREYALVEWIVAEKKKKDSPHRFGLGTMLGCLGQSLTCIVLHTRLWVRSLYTAWEGVWHPRLPGLWAGLHCVTRPYLIKEFIKRALILNLTIHHALKEVTHTTY